MLPSPRHSTKMIFTKAAHPPIVKPKKRELAMAVVRSATTSPGYIRRYNKYLRSNQTE